MPVSKPAYTLTAGDIALHPIWRYKPEESLAAGEDESWVEPVDQSEVTDAFDHFFGAKALLSDGTEVPMLVGNTEPLDPGHNELAQFFVFFRDDKQMRWHPKEHGAGDLAQFLNRSVDRTFPFKFDISRYMAGDRAALVRTVWSPSRSAR